MVTTVSAQEIHETTGVTVSETKVVLAWSSIEAFTGRRLVGDDAPVLSLDDALWVRRAVIYQAAWLSAQADAFERTDVEMLAHDELTVRPRDQHSFVLAPMARQVLTNCSWSADGSLGGGQAPARTRPRSSSLSTVSS